MQKAKLTDTRDPMIAIRCLVITSRYLGLLLVVLEKAIHGLRFPVILRQILESLPTFSLDRRTDLRRANSEPAFEWSGPPVEAVSRVESVAHNGWDTDSLNSRV